MARDRDREVPWGGFLLLALLLAIAGAIFFAADLRRLVEGTYTVVAAFPDGGSIRPGAPVWIAGRESGRVTRVDILRPTDRSTGGIVVEAEFPASARDILGSESRVRMNAGSPTSGEVVEFLPGGGAALTPTDTVWGFEPPDRLEHLVDGLGALAGQMQAMFDTVQVVADAGEIRVERLDDLGSQAAEVTELLEEFSAATQRSAGARGDLLGDIDRLTAGIGRLGSLLARAREAVRGPAATRSEAAALRDRLPATIGALREELAALQAALDDPNGTLSRLQSDSALWRAIGAARAEADSLFEELSGDPGRMF
jgi:ABC-type transporter Mla subunit MlaD